ncbi:TetR/AcrR family transcriptional regulator, partial [Neorhizobium sp. JUb45]|uniref:TetR/AcrR family transcriptional regulator n=2 Tax=unclassified Neorhizobium TaxID=2629175 RepID=UPI001042AD6F
HGTKVSDIVAEAGLSQPSFYLYFDSKESTYETLVEEFRESLRFVTLSNLIAPDTQKAELEERVAVSFRRFLDFMASDRSLTEIGFFHPPGCSVTKQQMVDWVADNIRKEQVHRIFRKDITAEEIAKLLVGILDQFGRIDADEAERQRLADVCGKLFCSGAGS